MANVQEQGVNFSSVPILDYSLINSPTTKPQFILQLRHALINVGFLYLANHSVDAHIIGSLKSYIPKLFALPQDEKDKIGMANSEHFLGYSRIGKELTKGKVDQREQFDFATPHVCRWIEGETPKELEYLRLWGACQVSFISVTLPFLSFPNSCSVYKWPDETLIPGFRQTLEEYFAQVQQLSYDFSSLLAEAFGLPPDALRKFYDTDANMQHRGKIVRYPVIGPGESEAQGVGPHYDAGFLTFVSYTLPPFIRFMESDATTKLLQASPHKGLQVQNLSGQWIDAPPIDGTFVVNIGKG